MLIEFCLPVYNEEKILAENVATLLEYCKRKNFSFNWHIMIVVNGSKDDSAKIARGLAQVYSEIFSMEIEQEGKGRAVKQAWQSSPADIFVYMDVDLAVSLENLEVLLDAVIRQNYDLSLGSRLLPKSQTNRPYWRSVSSVIYNHMSRALLGHRFSDLQCGFKAIRSLVRDKIIDKVENDYWFFDTELVIWAHKAGFKIKEIPVHWQENRYQKRKSKINVFRDCWQFILKLIQLRDKIKTPF